MPSQFLITAAIYTLIVASVILTVEAIFIYMSRKKHYKGSINRRMNTLEKSDNPEIALRKLLEERGLDNSGEYILNFVSYNRLFLQSGMTGNPVYFLIIFAMAGLFLGIASYLFNRSFIYAILIFSIIAIILPILTLMRMRGRRQIRFSTQLPEAMEVVVRSLRAGHPTPVALALVGKELADPIGTEFGIVADEMTYGMELVEAMRNLFERVGVDDLRIVVVALSIQQTTGGNLAEILTNLAKVIRDRFRMRRKIKAVSAEGRISAFVLSIFPFFLFAAINLLSPAYYGLVWSNPIVVPVLVATVIWMALGDFIMYRLVNFEF